MAGSKISRRQSGQVAMSGITSAVLPPPVSLARISNCLKPTASSHEDSRLWMKLRGGFSVACREGHLNNDGAADVGRGPEVRDERFGEEAGPKDAPRDEILSTFDAFDASNHG